jgi:hypothetical protein
MRASWSTVLLGVIFIEYCAEVVLRHSERADELGLEPISYPAHCAFPDAPQPPKSAATSPSPAGGTIAAARRRDLPDPLFRGVHDLRVGTWITGTDAWLPARTSALKQSDPAVWISIFIGWLRHVG